MGSSSPRFGVKIKNVGNHHLLVVVGPSRLFKSLKVVTFKTSCKASFNLAFYRQPYITLSLQNVFKKNDDLQIHMFISHVIIFGR